MTGTIAQSPAVERKDRIVWRLDPETEYRLAVQEARTFSKRGHTFLHAYRHLAERYWAMDADMQDLARIARSVGMDAWGMPLMRELIRERERMGAMADPYMKAHARAHESWRRAHERAVEIRQAHDLNLSELLLVT